ncbi:MAG TPA: NAD(P)-binding domain-containing protein [Steroidobacteraceae bacterium]|nr:NAD(P)-binding domain-containing protein [Steroidobacteraceae bacterium]
MSSIPTSTQVSLPAAVLVATMALMLGSVPHARAAPADASSQPGAPIKIGIIGTGHIGGTLATLWVNAGHEVLMSSRHPQELQALAHSLGPKAHVGTPAEAAKFGEVVVISVPYGALPQVGRDFKNELAGKVVLDTGNPYPERDGQMAVEARRKGTGVASAEYLPGVRLVRAFNAINSGDLRGEAHRKGAPIAIPLAGDDAQALQVAERLVRDAGFAPVVVGPLSKAREFDVGTPAYTRVMTEPQLKAALGLK